MTASFFRFPSTAHLAWFGSEPPRADKVLSDQEVRSFLDAPVCVEEKLDGANIGLSITSEGTIAVQNRGAYLDAPYRGQFSRLSGWLVERGAVLQDELKTNQVVFGEWMTAQHSIYYNALPDWFLLFDIYDKDEEKFWSVDRRNEWAKRTGIFTVPEIQYGYTNLSSLKKIVSDRQSEFGACPIEGVVVRRDEGLWCASRAKLVAPNFIQAIETHWRSKSIVWNSLASRC
jgi:ATP-dependent RNA circularization protein (DNA/RNA ligase family)